MYTVNCSRPIMLAALGVLLCVSVSQADTMTYNGLGLSQQVQIHSPGYLTDGATVNAGQLLIGYDGHSYKGYCVDLDHYVTSPQTVTAVSVLSLNRGDKVAYLFETYGPTIATNVEAAALQSAIWEVIFETASTLNVTTGAFSITDGSGVYAQANTWLATLPAGPYVPSPDTIVLDAVDGQDVLIPEPTSMALLAIGACSVLLNRRRGVTV